MNILLIEDEKRMSEAVYELLRREGYMVKVCLDGVLGFNEIMTGDYDGAICDVMLPGMNGFDIVKAARASNISTAILMLTAKSDISDKVAGLDYGADDYLTKPFQVEELLARLRAILRRNNNVEDGRLIAGDLELNTKAMILKCTSNLKEIRLPEKEFNIMKCLMTNQNQIVSKDTLAVKVWGYENEAEYNNVEVYISFTRKKIKFLEANTQIKSVRGMGYELRG